MQNQFEMQIKDENCSLKARFLNDFGREYLRNNKTNSVKNLLCFPHCKCSTISETPKHESTKFCGTSISVEVTFSRCLFDEEFNIDQILQSFKFVGEVQEIKQLVVEPVRSKDTPPKQDIDSPQEDDTELSPLEQHRMKALSDSSTLLQGTNGISFDQNVSNDIDNPLEDRHVGVVVGLPQMNEENEFSVTVVFNQTPKSWSYGWVGGKNKKDVRHSFCVDMFYNPNVSDLHSTFHLLGTICSPEFKVSSKRRGFSDKLKFDQRPEETNSSPVYVENEYDTHAIDLNDPILVTITDAIAAAELRPHRSSIIEAFPNIASKNIRKRKNGELTPNLTTPKSSESNSSTSHETYFCFESADIFNNPGFSSATYLGYSSNYPPRKEFKVDENIILTKSTSNPKISSYLSPWKSTSRFSHTCTDCRNPYGGIGDCCDPEFVESINDRRSEYIPDITRTNDSVRMAFMLDSN